MKTWALIVWILAAGAASGAVDTFGRFPLGTNTETIRVGDWQCIHSALVERCAAADIPSPALALPMTVFTGMCVVGVVTGDIPTITTNVPPTTNHVYYYTTNYAPGSTNLVLATWSGTNMFASGVTVHQAFAWSGPMRASTLSSWDAALLSIVTRYLDLGGMGGTNWLGTPIGATTNIRVNLINPCPFGGTAATTNRYTVPIYRAAPLMLSVSNAWSQLHIGTDFYYNTGTNTWEQFHAYKLTLAPSASVEYVLGAFVCVITNTFFTTNVTSQSTSLVRNVHLAFGTPSGSSYLGRRNAIHAYPPIPLDNLNYAARTNGRVFLRVVTANTNVPAPDLRDMSLTLLGNVCDYTTNNHAGYYVARRTSHVASVVSGMVLPESFYGLIAEDLTWYNSDAYWDCITGCGDDWEQSNTWACWMGCDGGLPGSTSTWSRVETNGQWDSLIGTTIEVVWSNTCAFYGDPDGSAISPVGLDERYRLITSLVATVRWTDYKSDHNVWAVDHTGGACYPTSNIPLDKQLIDSFPTAPTPVLVATTNYWQQYVYPPGISGTIAAYLRDYYDDDMESVLVTYRAMSAAWTENLTGLPVVRMLTPSTNTPPPAVARMRTFGRIHAGVDAFSDPLPAPEFLRYVEQQDYTTQIDPVVANFLDYFGKPMTNWCYMSAPMTLPRLDYLSQAYWTWEIGLPTMCPTFNLYSGGGRFDWQARSNMPSCVSALVPGTNGALLVTYSVGQQVTLTWDLFSYLYFDFRYK